MNEKIFLILKISQKTPEKIANNYISLLWNIFDNIIR